MSWEVDGESMPSLPMANGPWFGKWTNGLMTVECFLDVGAILAWLGINWLLASPRGRLCRCR